MLCLPMQNTSQWCKTKRFQTSDKLRLHLKTNVVVVARPLLQYVVTKSVLSVLAHCK